MQPLQSTAPESTESTDRTSDALVLRNHGHDDAVTLTLTIETLDGTTVFEERYRLSPLTTRVLDVPVAPGTYRVAATIDTKRPQDGVCALGDSPTRAACVETGNGVVSVVDGVG